MFMVYVTANMQGNPDLLKVQLNIIDLKTCKYAFKRTLPNGPRMSQLCAGNIAGGKDTCQVSHQCSNQSLYYT